MKIPTAYKGTLYFYYMPDVDVMLVTPYQNQRTDQIFLGSKEVDVEFNGQQDATAQAVKAIDRRIEQERAASRARIETLLGQKQSLLALEAE